MVLSIPPNTFMPRHHPFELVLFTTAESAKVPSSSPTHHQNYGMYKIKNVVRMLSLFQLLFPMKGVVFTNTVQIRRVAERAGLTVVRNYKSEWRRGLMRRTNPYKMPYIRDMFVTAKKLFDSSYYGYINSDVLLSYQIFDVIKILRYNAHIGKLGPHVRSVVIANQQHEIAGRVHEVAKYNLIDDKTLRGYMNDLKAATRVMRPLRNQHSAVGCGVSADR